ncbi:MAG: methylornithine synthase PylB [Ruminococcus sp.]
MIKTILNQYENEAHALNDAEIAELLSAQGSDREAVFSAARRVRAAQFGTNVFLYGFVYFSTYCRNNCNFCYFRCGNNQPPRYRKMPEEIIETAVSLKESGVHLIDLTMGEDPYYTEYPERLADLVQMIKQKTGLAVMVSPGVVSDDCIRQLAQAGSDWYALYQETHNSELFRKLRADQSYEARMHCKMFAKSLGICIEEGLLTGVGETVEDRIHSFREMERMGAMQVRTMTFVPQAGTPMMIQKQSDFSDELLNIAVMRMLFPDRLIPASLDVDGLNGLESRLMAGANVITSIIPPREGYAGVAHASQDIDEGYRTVAGVRDTVLACELHPATADEYQAWLRRIRK